jgi:hypothetical protein
MNYYQYKVIIVAGPRGRKEPNIPFLDRHSAQTNNLVEQKVLELLTYKNIESVITGGAMGIDTIFLYYLYNHRVGEYPKVAVILPVDIEFQPRETQSFIRQANMIIQMKQRTTDEKGNFNYGMYKKRNKAEITLAKLLTSDNLSQILLLAFWNYNKVRSGTWSTISMCKESGIDVEIVDIRVAH